jgi:hypothetical protein
MLVTPIMSEEQSMDRPERDDTAERQERDAFLVLYHIFSVTAANPDVELAAETLARDLAFERPDITLLVDHLALCGCVRCQLEGGLSITPDGIDYIGQAAGRRRSVRARRGQPGSQKWSGIAEKLT